MNCGHVSFIPRAAIFLLLVSGLSCSIWGTTPEQSEAPTAIATPPAPENPDANLTIVPAAPTQASGEIPPPPVVDETPAPEFEPARPPASFGQAVETPSGERRLDFPAVPKVLLDKPMPPHRGGTTPPRAGQTSGPAYIGHRAVIEKYAGWGWIRREDESWRSAKWVVLRESPGSIQAPGRYLAHPDNDNDVQYRIFGHFSDKRAYEPNFDTWVDVFDLTGFEVIGPAPRPNLRPPRAQGKTHSRPTTGGVRSNPFGR